MGTTTEKLHFHSGHMVPVGAVLVFTCGPGSQINWRPDDVFTGPDSIVVANSTSYIDCRNLNIRIFIYASGDHASYQELVDQDADNFRIANGLLPFYSQTGTIYGG